MSSPSDEQNALTGGVELIQCSVASDDHDDETERQIETFLEVLAAVCLAVAARSIESGQGVAE